MPCCQEVLANFCPKWRVGRRNIAKHSSHIRNVEAQLQQLQLQLNLTSGPKKSALEMLRKKIEAKNEEVVLARNKFLSAQKVQHSCQCSSAVIMLNASAQRASFQQRWPPRSVGWDSCCRQQSKQRTLCGAMSAAKNSCAKSCTCWSTKVQQQN